MPSKRQKRSAMRRLCPSVRSLLTSLVLGLLLMALGAESQSATAQQFTFDSDQPIQSLEEKVRSNRLQRQVESLTDQNRAHNDRSARISTDVVNKPQTHRVERDRSASTTRGSSRSDARSDNSSSRDRSKVKSSSNDEGGN